MGTTVGVDVCVNDTCVSCFERSGSLYRFQSEARRTAETLTIPADGVDGRVVRRQVDGARTTDEVYEVGRSDADGRKRAVAGGPQAQVLPDAAEARGAATRAARCAPVAR